MIDAQMFLQLQAVPRTEYTVVCYIYSTVASTSSSTYQRTQPVKTDNRRVKSFVTMATGV